jgi:hypothetical protein
MVDSFEGPPVVLLPERVDRRLRLGPFASAQDALKFLSYAAAGAVLAAVTSPWVWLAVAALGFAMAIVRVDGRTLDGQLLAIVRWRLRRGGTLAVTTGRGSPGPEARRVLGVSDGRYVAIVRAGGTPVAYLPPPELARKFEQFRDLLRGLDGPVGLFVSAIPMRAAPVTPAAARENRPDTDALSGYRELVTLLCRRRHQRRVDLVLATSAEGAEGAAALETRAGGLFDRLAALGLTPHRLRDRALDDGARKWGWAWERAPR